SAWPSWDHCATSTRWPTYGSRRCTGRSPRRTISSERSKRCARTARCRPRTDGSAVARLVFMPVDLHPDLEALAPLLGTWVGQGEAKSPTIQPFEYLEEVVFTHVGKPFLAYAQKTRAAADGRPLHAETGYLRVPQPGHVELVLAHPNGITEIEVGNYSVTDDR